MQFKQAQQYILDKLSLELSANLIYHSIDHVIDVFEAAKNLAELENISAYETQLLLTAACYHDAGFLIKANGHEEESCRIAQRVLPDYTYTPDEVNLICGLIMSTRLPQSPLTHLEQIMADADLDYLGRSDFFAISQKLYQELLLSGLISNEQEWNRAQIIFMEKHRYFTQTAINLRQKVKEENLRQIKATTILPH